MVARPEMHTAFIIIHCFPGVQFTMRQTSRTTLEFKCVITLRDDILTRVAYRIDVSSFLLKHTLPPKTVIISVDVEKTIIYFDNITPSNDNVKVIVVQVQDDANFKHKVKVVC